MIHYGSLTTFVVLTGTVLGLLFPPPHAAVSDDFSQRIVEVYGKNIFTVYACYKLSGGKASESAAYRQNVGKAFSFDGKGHLITLNSVVKKAEKIFVISPTGERMNARVLGCVDAGEINVLKIESAQALSAPNLPLDKKLSPGTEVVLLSIARGKPIVLNTGKISARKPPDDTFIIDVMSQPDTCGTPVFGKAEDILDFIFSRKEKRTAGTPVFDKAGDLLGFIAYRLEICTVVANPSTKNEATDDINSYLIIPLEYAWIIANSIVNLNESRCGWLGIYAGLFNSIDSEETGIVVRKIMQNSPAEACGLRENDRVVALNETPVARPVELIELMSATKPGDVVTIKILRGGRSITSKATLSSYPTSD